LDLLAAQLKNITLAQVTGGSQLGFKKHTMSRLQTTLMRTSDDHHSQNKYDDDELPDDDDDDDELQSEIEA
jgi:hypothetical protein